MSRTARPGSILHMLIAIGMAAASTCRAQYRLVPGHVDADGCAPTSPAWVCLDIGGSNRCYVPPSDKKNNYVFGLEPKAESIGNLWKQPLTLFSATFSACGSGSLTDYSLLAIREGEFIDLLPTVRLSNQSELSIWNVREVSPLPIILTADFLWNFEDGETHFSGHRYQIDVYTFDQASERYTHKLSYQTTRKYPGLDEAESIRVIEPERQTILAKLHQD
jgi:hypothetical protein